MIADADRSLANFLGSVLDGTTVTFDTPSDEWAKSVKRPALSCFLHRVVEDIARRPSDWADERGPDGRVGARQPPVRHYQLHYQVSAWAKSVEDEHRILGRVMDACLSGEVLSRRHLAGVFEHEDAEVKRTIIAASSEVMVVVASEKLETSAPFILGPVSIVDRLVTDALASEEALRPYVEMGIEIIRANA